MNRTEYKNNIKLHQQNAEKFSKYQDRMKAKIEKLQQQLDKAQNDERYENSLVEYLELAMQKETNAKRKVTGYLKQYPMIHLDDESDHDEGERGTYLWLYCGLYEDHNEEDDPYYDSHYMDDWSECQERCETYIKLIKKTKEVA
jgi:hypothetical protein